MNAQIKQLIEKNKQAHKNRYYIESIFLSHTLVLKIVKQIISESNLTTSQSKLKLTELIKILKTGYQAKPELAKRLKKSTFKQIGDFNEDFKSLVKELKYQFPEVKLESTSKKGLHLLTLLHTAAIKNKNNKLKA